MIRTVLTDEHLLRHGDSTEQLPAKNIGGAMGKSRRTGYRAFNGEVPGPLDQFREFLNRIPPEMQLMYAQAALDGLDLEVTSSAVVDPDVNHDGLVDWIDLEHVHVFESWCVSKLLQHEVDAHQRGSLDGDTYCELQQLVNQYIELSRQKSAIYQRLNSNRLTH